MENFMIKGVVQKADAYQTSFGEMYNLTIDGNKVGFGKARPQAQVGDYVQVLATRKDQYINAVKGSLTKLEQPTPQAQRAPAPPTGAAQRGPFAEPARETPASGGITRDMYWSNKEANDVGKDKRITLIASRNTAIEFVGLLHTLGGIAIPKAAKPAEIAAAAEALVRGYTQLFYEQTMDEKPESDNETNSDTLPEDTAW